MASRSLFSAVSGNLISRRGYVATSTATWEKVSKGGSKIEDRTGESAWAPDPVTGYYRPSNRVDEIDPAELREMLLKNKTKTNSIGVS